MGRIAILPFVEFIVFAHLKVIPFQELTAIRNHADFYCRQTTARCVLSCSE